MYRALSSTEHLEFSNKKQSILQVSEGFKNNIGSVISENYPVQHKKIYIITNLNTSTTWAAKHFCESVQSLGIKLSGVFIPNLSGGEVDFCGLMPISKAELMSKDIGSMQVVTSLLYSEIKKCGLDFAEKIVYLYDDILNQYFEENILVPKSDEIFVDMGAFDLQTSLDFVKWAKHGYKEIHAFEPDKSNYKQCLNRIATKNEFEKLKIHMVNKGAGLKNEKIRFSENGGSSSISADGVTEIEVVSLDSYLNGSPVTFIKMDIEGAELDALMGAKDTISKWKPRIAISIYHKHSDVIDIPKYILSLVPEYRMYIRHYTARATETVLFCTI